MPPETSAAEKARPPPPQNPSAKILARAQRAIRTGHLTATATPLTRGRRSHLWECAIVDEEGRLIATGRVRLHSFDPGDDIAGAQPVMERG